MLSSGELSCLNQLAYNLTHGISRLEIKQYDRVNTKVDIRSCGRQPRAHGPNLAPPKKSSGLRPLRLRQFVAILSCIASGAPDKSEILVLDKTYKNISNQNKHAAESMFGSIYLACKILINESHQPIAICKIFNRLHAIWPKGFRAGSLQA